MGACFNIAIDGPAGAGKSTIAKQVAAQMGSIYVDTGAMYRAMALYLLQKGLDPAMAESDPEGFLKKVEELCREPEISIEYRDGVQVVLLNGENVNGKLRTQEVSDMASKSSGVGKLRKRLVELQQELAKKTSVVMDGRDIGTVVLPDADVKVYLTADSRVRARRRYLENLEAKKKGRELSPEDLDLDAIEKDVKERDARDMNRAESPLRQAEDAVLVDSSDMTIDQVVETILNLAAQKKGRPQVITARTAGFCFGVEK
ncbi:MAG: (d)CMP kinase, partial [Lachnospiraceae bacterium]